MALQHVICEGIVQEEHFQHVFERLRNLCCGSDTEETLHQWELAYADKSASKKADVRARCDIKDASDSGNGVDGADRKWRMVYLGKPSKHLTNLPKVISVVREEVSIDVSDNVQNFLSAMGYRFDFELVRRGHRFIYPGHNNMHVEIFKLHKLSQRHMLKSEEILSKEHWLVQMWATCGDQKHLKDIYPVVGTFVDTLKPYFLQAQ